MFFANLGIIFNTCKCSPSLQAYVTLIPPPLQVFNHIFELIKDADGIADFDITKTTLPDRARDRWIIPYRHWKFLAAEFKQKKD